MQHKSILITLALLITPVYSFTQQLVPGDYKEIFHLIGGAKPVIDDSKTGPDLKEYLQTYGPSKRNFPKKFNKYSSIRKFEFEIEKLTDQIDPDFSWKDKGIKSAIYLSSGNRMDFYDQEITVISQPLIVSKDLVLSWVSKGNAKYGGGGTYFYLLEKVNNKWKVLHTTQLGLE